MGRPEWQARQVPNTHDRLARSRRSSRTDSTRPALWADHSCDPKWGQVARQRLRGVAWLLCFEGRCCGQERGCYETLCSTNVIAGTTSKLLTSDPECHKPPYLMLKERIDLFSQSDMDVLSRADLEGGKQYRRDCSVRYRTPLFIAVRLEIVYLYFSATSTFLRV